MSLIRPPLNHPARRATLRSVPLHCAALFACAAGALFLAGTAGAADDATLPVERITVRAVAQFGFDRSALRPQDEAKILAEVGKLSDVTWQTVVATGHTDSIGADAYNTRLAAKRADAVKSYLVGKGLDPAMITTRAKAAAAPAASNATPAGRAANRRAEIEFQGVRTASR